MSPIASVASRALALTVCLVGCTSQVAEDEADAAPPTVDAVSDVAGTETPDSSPPPADLGPEVAFETCLPAGSTQCDGATRIVCNESGSVALKEDFPEDTVCLDGACVDCPEGTSVCYEKQKLACSEHFQEYTLEPCPDDTDCVNGFCVVCYPGTLSCDGPLLSEIWQCKSDGSGVAFDSACPVGTQCFAGVCLDPCSTDFKTGTSVGCDYYAVDLENAATGGYGVLAADAPFAIVASNPSTELPLQVSIHETFGAPALPEHTAIIQPLGAHIFTLPPRNITGSMRGELAWYVAGTRPFVAHQFNPLDNVNKVYSNDASLLLPARSVGSNYLAVTGQSSAFVTIVGVHPDTEVTVIPTAPIAESPEGTIPFIKENTSWTTTIQPGEVVNLRSQKDDLDLTGTEVSASDVVVVFAGNQGTTSSDECCADHLEQQLLPVNLWGTVIAVGGSAGRGLAPDYWRVVSGADGTTVTADPPVMDPVTLDRGEWIEVVHIGDLVFEGSGPIQVAQILASSHEVTADGRSCTETSQCDDEQQCVIFPNETKGTCRTTCQVEQNDCPYASDGCHERSWHYAAALSPGDGLCYRNLCDGGATDCGDGTQCTEGVCWDVCADGCDDAFGACGDKGCLPPLCGPETDYECPNDGICDILDAPVQCRARCTPVAACPDPQYWCLDERWFNGAAPFVDGVCTVPYCWTDADCPEGHGCGTNLFEGPWTCEPLGDPALIVWPSVNLWRSEYVFLAPDAYLANYITVVSTAGPGVLSIDGTPVGEDEWTPIGAGGYRALRRKLAPGVHRATGTEAFGLVGYGFDDDVSYGYLGGSKLSDISP